MTGSNIPLAIDYTNDKDTICLIDEGENENVAEKIYDE